MLATGDDGIPIGKELLLAVSDVTGSGSAGRGWKRIGCGRIPIASSCAKTQSFERGQMRFLERLEEKPPGKLLVVFKIGIVGIACVAHAVENARSVVDGASEQVAVK